MLRSFYIAGTGMLAQRAKMSVLTNNLTNIDTTGYKKDVVVSRSFQDLLIQNSNDPSILRINGSIGAQNTGVHVEQLVTVFSQGNFEQTSRMSDLAIEGEGFFVIETPQGNRYTRDGSFTVGRGGYLINSDGHFVSGTNGNIFVGDGEFSVDEQGYVTVDGQPAGRLRIVTFDDLSGLRKSGDNLYSNYTGQAEREAVDAKVKQGWLEGSNVDMASEIVSMVELNRAYELNQRVLKMVDESLSKTVNEVGRV